MSGKITVDANAKGNTYAGGYLGYIEAGTVTLVNLPDNYIFNFSVVADSANISSDEHYASICPVVKDGYILYDGDNPSHSVIFADEMPAGRVNEWLSIKPSVNP